MKMFQVYSQADETVFYYVDYFAETIAEYNCSREVSPDSYRDNYS